MRRYSLGRQASVCWKRFWYGAAAPVCAGNGRRWVLLFGALLLAALGVAAVCIGPIMASTGGTITGIVVDAKGPVPGAIVRQQTTMTATTSASDGTFTLIGVSEAMTVTVTAWAESYWPAGVKAMAGDEGITLTLIKHPADDNPDYPWLTSFPDPEKPIGCGHCMVAFPQWETNAHALSAVNPRFFSLYRGTDLSGTLLMGDGYKDDFPGTAGNCANCHAPGAAANHPFSADMDALQGVNTEGVFCDFCHKVAGVYLDPATGLPYANAPGVQSMRLNRPPTDTHMFYGPFDDVTRRVSYLALEKQSQFCAPCHQFSFWGTPIYESFREWLESPYPELGIECQTCHMAPTGVDYFVFPEKGGLIRDPDLIASHLQPGAADTELLQETVTLTLRAEQRYNRIWATVAITNAGAGHHVPTDFPGRHMILTLAAIDARGQALQQRSGPVVPVWGGLQASMPGTAFAKVLRDVESGAFPVVNYWKPTVIVSDNRIPAFATDVSDYAFDVPFDSDVVTVTAELRFRRAFQTLMDAKDWDTPDIVMETAQASVAVVPSHTIFLPVLIRD